MFICKYHSYNWDDLCSIRKLLSSLTTYSGNCFPEWNDMSSQGTDVLSLEHPSSLMIIMATAICPTLLHLDGPWPWHQS